MRKLFDRTATEAREVEGPTMAAVLFEGPDSLEVKGEASYQKELSYVLSHFGRQVFAVLQPEPDNSYDSNAVAVLVGGLKVGYLNRGDAANYQPAVLRLQQKYGKPIALKGRIVGGTEGRESFGIWLNHDATDFGLASRQVEHAAHVAERNAGGVWTGTTAAKQEWMARAPSDRLAAIKYLRGHLASEIDPLERHFLLNELEDALYECRDIFDSALTEYEAACLLHDAEMEAIRPLLVAALGGVPYIPTYKQVAIMKAKAKDFAAALKWAERGLELYGSEGLREEMVADLRNRAGQYRGKLAK